MQFAARRADSVRVEEWHGKASGGGSAGVGEQSSQARHPLFEPS
jgi:hypothetical protein